VTTGTPLTTEVIHHVVHCFAVVRAERRREPLMAVNAFGGLLTVLVTWLCAGYGGPPEIAPANPRYVFIDVPIVFAYYKRRLGDRKDGSLA
jgi:hypothetical protein